MSWQTEQKNKNRESIIQVLNDGQQHQYGEILKKTKLSRPILAKHIKELLKNHLIEKKEGEQDFRTVYYKATPRLMLALEIRSTTEQEKHNIERIILNPKKTTLDVLDQLSTKINDNILLTLKLIKENKDISPESLDLILALFVWQPYKVLTSFLIEKSKKIIDKIDVENLIESNKSTIRVGKNDLKSIGFTDEMIAKMLGD